MNADTGAIITEGRAIRIYAKIQEDGNLKSETIPDDIRHILAAPGKLNHIETDEFNDTVDSSRDSED